MNNRFRAEKSGERLLELSSACIVKSVPHLVVVPLVGAHAHVSPSPCLDSKRLARANKHPRPELADFHRFRSNGEYSRVKMPNAWPIQGQVYRIS